MTKNYKALKTLLDQLVEVRHLQEFTNQEKAKAEKIEVKLNPRFDWGREDADNAIVKDVPIGTIYMIRDPHDPEFENRI